MAIEKESSALVEGGKHVFDSLWNWSEGGDVGRWIILISIVLIAVTLAVMFLLKALAKAIEGMVKLSELYKSSGLPLPLSNANKVRVRKRAQFCRVLGADLNYMAKAESWNDQYFTDLEAEVETEGGYYASAFHRVIGRRSQGLRKERSLIRAITSSTERGIQLVGEPGAGKSVALRHLASQLAARGSRSKAKHAIVPLYVNLREMDSSEPEKVNADSIRDFILDNIRRGDSDTSAFVRENWDEYRDKGVWFFLFDSFDEIPAILHAAKGSAAAAAYSKAIRHFIEGMGGCKGVLGSREFKGPEALPWKKFRILPLHSDKQHELVRNAFLSPDQEKIALHHLAQAGGTLGTTPLFLTLLCRYVRAENKAPANDYDLLSLHIDWLARRDPRYLERKYSLTPEELIAGAERIARLFAEEPTLGLAPATDQVEQLVPSVDIPGGDVSQLISALVDCKIGRADVPNAAHGDRRFAFSHRRYQEALFVRFLVSHPGHLSADELLTAPRWREYAVTLLQTEPVANIEPILAAASHFLISAAIQQKQVPARAPVPKGCGYFEWKGESTTYVLELLQEGLAHRINDTPRTLSLAVHQLLRLRWQSGDTFDRCEVVRLGALLPQLALTRYLAMTFRSGTRNAEAIAFQQTAVLRGRTPKIIREAVLKRVSNDTLSASGPASLIRLEALAARLPESLGASFVFQRNVKLRGIMSVLSRVVGVVTPFSLIERTFDGVLRAVNISPSRQKLGLAIFPFSLLFLGLVLLQVLFFSLLHCVESFPAGDHSYTGFSLLYRDDFSYLAAWWIGTSVIDKWPVLVAASLMLPYFALSAVYALRAKGERLNLHFYYSRLTNPVILKRSLTILGVLVGLLGTMFGVVVVLGLGVKWLGTTTGLFKLEEPAAAVGLVLTAVGTYSFGLLATLVGWFKNRRFAKELEKAKATIGDDFVFLCNVQGIQSVARSLALKANLPASDTDNRSFASLLLSVSRIGVLPNLPAVHGGRNKVERQALRTCLQLLEDRLPSSTSDATAG